MINSVQQNQIAFSGKSFKKIDKFGDFADEFAEEIRYKNNNKRKPSVENYRAYANIKASSGIKLEKGEYGYKAVNSTPLPVYKGPKGTTAGLSTEYGLGDPNAGYLGGGWIEADLNTPLSTRGVGSCVALNLIDKADNRHILYHVLDDTTADDIEKFIREKIPNFDEVNIAPGDHVKTNSTFNRVLTAVSNVNEKAPQNFYHFSSEAPEIVAWNDTLSHIESPHPTKMAFKEMDNYYN